MITHVISLLCTLNSIGFVALVGHIRSQHSIIIAMAPVMKKPAASNTNKPTVKKPASGGKDTLKTIKRPAGSLTRSVLQTHDQSTPAGGESLDAKIALFQKKGNKADFKEFLSSLSESERQSCWKKFEQERKSHPGQEEAYQKVVSGTGSLAKKQNLLKTFLENGCTVKARAYQEVQVAYTKDFSWTSESSWKPFHFMSNFYGTAELMRRVKNGSIPTRQDENGEWEFKHEVKKDTQQEKVAGGFGARSGGNLDSKNFQSLMDTEMAKKLVGSEDDKSGVIKFLQQQTPGLGKKTLSEEPLQDPDPDPDDLDIAQVERLSDLGQLGQNTKAKVGDAIKILNQAIEKTEAVNAKKPLQKHLKALQSLRSGSTSVETYKVKIIEAMQAVKKSGIN